MLNMLSCTIAVHADVPSEFSELFEYKERAVSIKDINGAGTTSVVLSVNYDSVRLPKNQEVAVEQLQRYFKRNNVSRAMSESILTSLEKGVKNTEKCYGYIRECVVMPSDYAFYYDYDNALLTLFVNGTKLDKPSTNVEYANALNDHGAFVNHVDIYSSAFHDSTSYAINNKSILGLPYGHLTSDFTASDSRNRLYELSYDLSFASDKRIYLGQFDNGVAFNSTDMVSPTRFIKQTSLNFGSTNNLVINDGQNYERLFFFSPAPGELRIVRDGRIIKQLQISEGQGTISYSELPSGRYDIELEVVVAGNVISSEKKTIYNNIANVPKVGNGDYVLSIGQFNESRDLFSAQFYELNEITPLSPSEVSRFDDVAFFSSLYSYRIADSWFAAAGALGADSDGMAVVGSTWYLPFKSALNSSVSIYQPGSLAFDARLAVNYFSVQYEKLQHKDNDDTLAAYLMGGFDYEKISGNIFYRFDNGLNSYYTYSSGEYYIPESGKLYTKYNLSTIGLGYTLPLNARLDLTLDYDHVGKSYATFMNFQIPFGSSWEAKFSTNDSSVGGRQYRSSLLKNELFDRSNTNSSLEVSSTYSGARQHVMNEMYGTASVNENAYRGNTSVYANDDGNYGISGSLSSSQLVSSNGVTFTSQRSDAYTIIDAGIQEKIISDNDPYGFVTLRKNEKLENKVFIYDKNQSMPISAYDSYDINIDTESVSLYNSGDQGFNGFTYPGSVVVIKPSLKPVVTFVSSFSDVFDDPIDEVLCKGFGCIDVTKVMDGVFRVTLVEGSDFSLYAGENRCLIPTDYEDAELMNFGNNYCLPDVKPRSIVSVVKQDTLTQSELYYVGTFDDTNLVKDYIKRLVSLDGAVYQRKVGSDIALYLLMDNEDSLTISKAQELIIDSMQLYARENHSLGSINQPVAMRDNSEGLQHD
ncbi:TcfC E-set like domain-containing protein [Aeromonas sp. FDAARGOS 1419]|uniref:TcfC E-set like domain-containing protein n=1 Tax=Aeromonas sp. FDAARGOS 1419 TaxID=2778068 RepID=UPI001C2505F3|nr:TcfC E-set like domain-containing protein [Aeromonas sp. FDAARGOS 1419]QWZ78086.1 TcfC E-set like domain-containing protein [Aeromonas sp. FDAARGOS 1419]